MNRAVRKFGWIAFVLGAVGYGAALIIGKQASYTTQELIGYAVMGMTAALVYFGVAFHRDSEHGGSLTFGQALKTGLLIAGFGALGVALISIFFTTFINPNFFQEYGVYQLAMAQESRDPVMITQVKESNAMYETLPPIGLSLMGGIILFFMTFLLGASCAVISGLILKK